MVYSPYFIDKNSQDSENYRDTDYGSSLGYGEKHGKGTGEIP